MTTSEFISQYRTADPRSLALKAAACPGVDVTYAMDQIRGWQTARHKLPSLAAVDGVVYPPHLSMEQCSSEATALYKRELVGRLAGQYAGGGVATASMADLTGGFGIDFMYMSQCFGTSTYIERSEQLCRIARHNFGALGLHGWTVCNADAAEALASLAPQTMIYLDPARRDAAGGRTYAIADCTPDVLSLLPGLMDRARFVVVKLSPMLDWHKAVADLGGTVRQVHIVSAGGECKELLLVLHGTGNSVVDVCCADITPAGTSLLRYAHDTATGAPVGGAPACHADGASLGADTPAPAYLYEPNASVMKAGCFGVVEREYGVSHVSANSHLFVADTLVAGFPGRSFAIDTVTTLNRQRLRQALGGVGSANIAVRNFPMTVADLRRRLKLKDGGHVYIFGTTTAAGEHVLVVAHKV